MSTAATVVVENARLELLRGLAWWRDWNAADNAERGRDLAACRCVPLFAGEWQNVVDDVLLAARECAVLGEVELHEEQVGGWVERAIAITDRGYARIRAHDAIAESAQSGGR